MSTKQIGRVLTLRDLPMFASDQLLAEAIVGPEKASDWLRFRLPTLEKKAGFPPIDDFHGGRSVRLVARFYDDYLGVAEKNQSVRRVSLDVEAWKPSKRQA